jgi:hypothetical protein
MAWKTPNGCWLDTDDKVVWINKETGGYDWEHTGTVVQCLPVNDDDDGKISIDWDNGAGPLASIAGKARIWYYPMWVEKIDSINALDRMVREL